jgi:hypothetical protein
MSLFLVVVCSLSYVVTTCQGCQMNQMHMVKMFMYVIPLPWIMSNCVQYFCSTRYKQYNHNYSNHNKILMTKCIWSYFSQFSTVFDDPGSEIDGIMLKVRGYNSHDVYIGYNRFRPVFIGSIIFFKVKDWQLDCRGPVL